MARTVDSLIYIQDNGLKNIQLDPQAVMLSGDRVKVLDCGVAYSRTYTRIL